MKNFLSPPDYREASDYQEAEDWYNNFDHDQGESPDACLDYANKLFDYTMSLQISIESKAESTFRFSAILLGVSLAATKWPGVTDTLVRMAAPSMVCYALAIVFAMLAKKPTLVAGPMPIRSTFDIHGNEHAAKRRIAAALRCAVTGLTSVNDWKARRTEWATWLVIAGIAWIVFVLAIVPAATGYIDYLVKNLFPPA